MATKDPLLDRLVIINDDATTPKGNPLPQAGLEAKVIGKTLNGRQYQLECDGTLINLPMADFTLVTVDSSQLHLLGKKSALVIRCCYRCWTALRVLVQVTFL